MYIFLIIMVVGASMALMYFGRTKITPQNKYDNFKDYFKKDDDE